MRIKSENYTRWINIKMRCFNVNDPHYPDYGARGITMYEPWVTDYKLFESYIDSLPHPPNTSLDRVNNDLGYYPMNLRFADKSTQQRNRRPRTSSSRYKWVTLHKGRFMGKYKHHGESIFVGNFDTPQDAHQAVVAHRINNGLKV